MSGRNSWTMSDTYLGDCRISFLGCLHAAHLFFHTTLEDARLSTALVAVVSYMDRKTLADSTCKQHHIFFFT